LKFGHSLHNNELSKSIIIDETQKAFDANKKEYPNGADTKISEGSGNTTPNSTTTKEDKPKS
jgi:hypothetical protein